MDLLVSFAHISTGRPYRIW